jgi:AcrR family transcriptional regulator
VGLSERKEREKLELRELILESSKNILLSQGKEGLSIRKIAAQVEYSPATIYLYFKDKDAILHELMEKGFDILSSYMLDGFNETDPAKRLHKIGVSYILFALDHKDWYDLMFNSSRPMKHMEKAKEDWDKGVQMFDFLTRTCQDYIDKEQRTFLKADILALQMWSSVHGLINLASTCRLDIVRVGDTKELLLETMDSIYNSLFYIK